MAMDYIQSAALMIDPVFVDRVKVACLKYAAYILDEPPSTPGHNSRTTWARGAVQNPTGTAQSTAPPVVMDSAVQEQGGEINDTGLQSAVETTLNKLF